MSTTPQWRQENGTEAETPLSGLSLPGVYHALSAVLSRINCVPVNLQSQGLQTDTDTRLFHEGAELRVNLVANRGSTLLQTEGQPCCKQLGSGRAGLAPSPLPLGPLPPRRGCDARMDGVRHRCGEETCLTCPNFHLRFSRQEKREPSAQVPSARSAPASRPTLFPLSWTCVRPRLTDPSIPLFWELLPTLWLAYSGPRVQCTGPSAACWRVYLPRDQQFSTVAAHEHHRGIFLKS